ncbi:MAG: glycerol-3-phosphate dehydrogenase/oxidase [Candidatus Nanopelagicales bacterium]
MDFTLNQQTRAAAIRRLRDSQDSPLDVLIIGGGVVGTGALLDAAVRGLDAVLVEKGDLAVGTSSRSSRLAHGGLRYLEHFEFGLVHEALTERGLLLDRLAPHLVHPVPFLFPVLRQWERPYTGAGIALYDTLSRLGAYGGTMPRPRALSKQAVLGMAPGMRADAFHSAVRFHDAQIDDARHTVAVARTAAGHGGGVVPNAAVVGLLSDGQRITGVRVKIDGAVVEAHSRVVLGAVGPWTDELLTMADPRHEPVLRPSKGSHLVVDRSAFVSTCALIARTPVSVLFALPWGRRWLIGTTDTEYDSDPDDVRTDLDDVDYLIGQANRWFERPLTRDDVLGVYAGVRPLVTEQGTAGTAKLSREHVVFRPTEGLLAIAGGKYTTYRVMAKDAIDAVLREGGFPHVDCTTDEVPLVGAEGFADLWNAREQLAARAGMSVDLVEGLLRRHGGHAEHVLALMEDEPALAERIDPESGYLLAEVVTAVEREAATTLADILVRRTRAALEVGDGGRAAAQRVIDVLVDHLGWDPAELQEQARALDLAPTTVAALD